MKEIVMIPLSDLQKYKEIEKKYNELISTHAKAKEQFGSGINDPQSILAREEENNLRTPHLELASDSPIDLLETVNPRYTQRAKKIIKLLHNSKSLNWDAHGNVTAAGNRLNGVKIQKVFPKIFSGLRRPGPESSFFKELKNLDAGDLIRSVEKGDKNWFYIGK
jgi:hypothetical protein